VQTDYSAFGDAAASVRAYVLKNFGASFQPLERGGLRPLPVGSPTFDPNAPIPVKLPPGSDTNKQLPRPRQVLNMASRGVDEGDTTLIALGDMAFDSSYIFGEPARSLQISCNTCHNKSITNPGFVVPGISKRPGGMDVSNSFFARHANNGHFDPLDIPDLRGIRFTAPYGRNGRFDSLREFVRNVIVNEFNGAEPDPTLLDGIIAYMIEFDFLPNPSIDADGSLSDAASDEARRGEAIFHRKFSGMGDRSCASCHQPSSNFLDHRRHDIGTVAGTGPASRDRAMDTPTLLSAAYTQPYFHDGSQPTLEAVNMWFNQQFSLGLNPAEIADLTAYVETVGSGVEAYEDTLYTLDAELEEFSFFLSAYEYLRQIEKPNLIAITFQTVAQEIHAHKWDLQNPEHLPTLNRLAELMESAYMSVNAGEVGKTDRLVAEYRKIYEENAHLLR
jgi:cytochrome c peroxidase